MRATLARHLDFATQLSPPRTTVTTNKEHHG
jgi:hypothetical protein